MDFWLIWLINAKQKHNRQESTAGLSEMLDCGTVLHLVHILFYLRCVICKEDKVMYDDL